MQPQGSVALDLVTAHMSFIKNKVVDAVGNPVSEALVMPLDGISPLPITPYSDPRHPGSAMTGADGLFGIAVREGTFPLRVRKLSSPEVGAAFLECGKLSIITAR